MLVFADDDRSTEDGLLHMSEVQEMRINADLVNLSACNTGLGEYVVGEGVMSLARGFVFAGAKSVVMSQWQVDDRSTADLMATFYREYSEDKKAGSALRDAKLEYLKNSDEITADPYYWGAWVHIGPDQRAPVNYRGVLLIVIMLIGGVIFVRVLVKGF
jgi:CHAT domain-containing protein